MLEALFAGIGIDRHAFVLAFAEIQRARLRRLRQQQREFVIVIARDGIGDAHLVAQQHGERIQQKIAGFGAVLKSINVEFTDLDEHDRKIALMTLAARDFHRQGFVEVLLVAQVSGFVDGCEPLQLAGDFGETFAVGLDALGKLAIFQQQARFLRGASGDRDEDFDVIERHANAVISAGRKCLEGDLALAVLHQRDDGRGIVAVADAADEVDAVTVVVVEAGDGGGVAALAQHGIGRTGVGHAIYAIAALFELAGKRFDDALVEVDHQYDGLGIHLIALFALLTRGTAVTQPFDAVAPGIFGAMQGAVCSLDELLGCTAVIRIAGEADADRDFSRARNSFGELIVGDVETQNLRHHFRAAPCGFRQDQTELLAAVARGDVGLAQPRLKNSRDLTQEFVAVRITVLLVEAFEVVEIDKQDGILAIVAARAGMFDIDGFVKIAMIVKAGEAVAHGEFLQYPVDLFEFFAVLAEALDQHAILLRKLDFFDDAFDGADDGFPDGERYQQLF